MLRIKADKKIQASYRHMWFSIREQNSKSMAEDHSVNSKLSDRKDKTLLMWRVWSAAPLSETAAQTSVSITLHVCASLVKNKSIYERKAKRSASIYLQKAS